MAQHGGNIREMARLFHIDESSIIDFSASINPLGMSSAAKEAIVEAVHSVERYPDPESWDLVEALADYHNMASENIVAGNGSTEFIYLIPRVFQPQRALIVAPAFSEYARALEQAGCRVDYFPLKAEEEFVLHLPSLFAILKNGFDTLWIGNPGNPAGTIIPKCDMKLILEMTAAEGILTVVDEAFIDFRESESVREEIKGDKKFLLLRSMTKFFAMPGLRVGYILGAPELIEETKRWKEPWTLNSIGSVAAVASLKDSSYRKETVDYMNVERDFLYGRLSGLPFLKTYPGSANYILVKLMGGLRSIDIAERLLKRDGILVRECGDYHSLSGEFIRMAVRRRSDNLLLIEALQRACGG